RVEEEMPPARPQAGVVRRLLDRLAERLVRAAAVVERTRRLGTDGEIRARPQTLVAVARLVPLTSIRECVAFGERLGTRVVLDRQRERRRRDGGQRQGGEQGREQRSHGVDRQSSVDSRAAWARSISCCTVASCNNNA